jgi:hypothetical protein
MPIEEGCDCPACSGGFSRSYLRHCFLAGEMLGPILCSLHNLRHFQRLLLDIRRAIEEDSWSSLPERWPVLVDEVGAVDPETGGLHDSRSDFPAEQAAELGGSHEP